MALHQVFITLMKIYQLEIITINQKADGIYYIDRGTVISQDGEGQVLATLGSGNIFGEMAYFSKDRRRNATVVAASDVVLRKIC